MANEIPKGPVAVSGTLPLEKQEMFDQDFPPDSHDDAHYSQDFLNRMEALKQRSEKVKQETQDKMTKEAPPLIIELE